jgi:sporulation protein YlmC with PRC-barrel domain
MPLLLNCAYDAHRAIFSMIRILTATLLAMALGNSCLAQSPDLAVTTATQHNQSLLEAQPPEQSGQAQQMMKEARAELERSAIELEGTPATAAAREAAREALVQFDQSLDQLHQSVPGYVPLELATSLHTQVRETLRMVETDTAAAAISMQELALRVTDLTAEADLLIGRALIGAGGAKLGTISNVLITEDGRIEAIVIDRTAPSQDQQFVVSWRDVSIIGVDFLSELTAAETDRLPAYPED